MNTLFFPKCALPFGLGALILLFAGCSNMTEPAAKILEVNENAATITAQKGEEHVTYDVAPEANITLDKKPAELKQLSAGDQVDVELEQRGGVSVAMRIDATSQAKLPREDSTDTTPSPLPVY